MRLPIGISLLLMSTTPAASQSPTPSALDTVAFGSNRHFHYTITVAAPAEAVWARWMDVGTWAAWDTELSAASAEAPLGPGVRGRLVPKRGRVSSFRVSAFVALERYTFDTVLPLATLRITRSLTLQGDSTTFTHDVRFDGLLAPVFAAKFGPQFRRVLPAVMRQLADLAARDAGSERHRPVDRQR